MNTREDSLADTSEKEKKIIPKKKTDKRTHRAVPERDFTEVIPGEKIIPVFSRIFLMLSP